MAVRFERSRLGPSTPTSAPRTLPPQRLPQRLLLLHRGRTERVLQQLRGCSQAPVLRHVLVVFKHACGGGGAEQQRTRNAPQGRRWIGLALCPPGCARGLRGGCVSCCVGGHTRVCSRSAPAPSSAARALAGTNDRPRAQPQASSCVRRESRVPPPARAASGRVARTTAPARSPRQRWRLRNPAAESILRIASVVQP